MKSDSSMELVTELFGGGSPVTIFPITEFGKWFG